MSEDPESIKDVATLRGRRGVYKRHINRVDKFILVINDKEPESWIGTEILKHKELLTTNSEMYVRIQDRILDLITTDDRYGSQDIEEKDMDDNLAVQGKLAALL